MIGLYGWAAAGVATLTLSTLLWITDNKLDAARIEAGKFQIAFNTAAKANTMVRETLQVCEDVNAFNAAQRDAAFLVANIAVGRAQIAEEELEKRNNEIFIPNDTNCRTLLDDLPADFVQWVCIDGTKNCSPD